jgi:hypothetical protein
MTYAPPWVKKDPRRFPRTITKPKGSSSTKVNGFLSVFGERTASADARAFAALMAHLKAYDGAEGQGTVLMVQVENEAGVLADTRDRSEAANMLFESEVPSSVIDTLDKAKREGSLNKHITGNFPALGADTGNIPKGKSWEATFGTGIATDELFMAYHYALFINQAAAAGKAAYDIPMFTNAALRSTSRSIIDNTGGGSEPGIYPSGGPVETVIDIYHLFAPSLDFVCPDIYFADYETMCKEYTHRGQALFVPEQRRDEPGVLRSWLAIGKYGALGTAPFGIDSITASESVYTRHYALIRAVEQHIHAARQQGRQVTSFFFDSVPTGEQDKSVPVEAVFGDWKLTIKRQWTHGHPAVGYGMIIQQPHSSDSFLLIGEGYTIAFSSMDPDSTFTGLTHMHEKEVVDERTGELVTRRKFNGDETGCGQVAIMPSENPDGGWYPIATYIPSRTRIAECEVYCI